MSKDIPQGGPVQWGRIKIAWFAANGKRADLELIAPALAGAASDVCVLTWILRRASCVTPSGRYYMNFHRACAPGGLLLVARARPNWTMAVIVAPLPHMRQMFGASHLTAPVVVKNRCGESDLYQSLFITTEQFGHSRRALIRNPKVN